MCNQGFIMCNQGQNEHTEVVQPKREKTEENIILQNLNKKKKGITFSW